MGPISQSDLNDLLEKWSIWLFERNSNAGNDANGTTVATKNGSNSTWFLPGTFGTRQTSPRNLQVPNGKRLFIVVASCHATKEELKPGDTADHANLLRLAKEIDVWDDLSLTIDGSDFTDMLRPAETEKFGIKIPAGSFYAGLINPSSTSRIDTEMVSVGQVFVFTVGKAGTKHTIELKAHAPAMQPTHGNFRELDYPMGVKYNITAT